MSIRTVGDLKRYLETSGLSPERLAREVKISNMTLRRLLAKGPNEPIPEKYLVQLNREDAGSITGRFERLMKGPAEGEFKALIDELEESGRGKHDARELGRKARRKLLDAKLGTLFKSHVRTVLGALKTDQLSLRTKAICIGAIVYFVNPFDLIPDALPGIGYLDDFAILSLVVGILAEVALARRDGKQSAPHAT